MKKYIIKVAIFSTLLALLICTIAVFAIWSFDLRKLSEEVRFMMASFWMIVVCVFAFVSKSIDDIDNGK